MFKAIEFIEKLIWLRFLWSILSHSSILAYTAPVLMDYVQELQTMFPENEEISERLHRKSNSSVNLI